MGKSVKRKMKLLVPEAEAADVLRAVADGLGSGSVELSGGAMSLEGFASLGVSLKRSPEGMVVKLKAKFPGPGDCDCDPDDDDDDDNGDGDDGDDDSGEDDEDDEDPSSASGGSPPGHLAGPKYSTLKKWMKKEFRAIKAALERGEMPEAGLADSFVADCRQMTRHPGKGDEYYPAFDAAVDAFEQAVASGELERAAAAAADLQALKDVCHDKYE